MDNQDIRTLKILEEIENNHAPSQRDMARKLNVSLGLVNSFIKRLARKGYFKITTIPANRVKYILTPKGVAEKTRLTYEYVTYSLHYYKITRKKLGRIFNDFSEQGMRRIVFFGFDDLAEIAYVALQETSLELVAVVDEKKAGTRLWGCPVIGQNDLASYDFDVLYVTTVGLPVDEAAEMLSETDVPRSMIKGI